MSCKGNHVFKITWFHVDNEKLKKTRIIFFKKNGTFFGHIPTELSSTIDFFLKYAEENLMSAVTVVPRIVKLDLLFVSNLLLPLKTVLSKEILKQNFSF